MQPFLEEGPKQLAAQVCAGAAALLRRECGSRCQLCVRLPPAKQPSAQCCCCPCHTCTHNAADAAGAGARAAVPRAGRSRALPAAPPPGRSQAGQPPTAKGAGACVSGQGRAASALQCGIRCNVVCACVTRHMAVVQPCTSESKGRRTAAAAVVVRQHHLLLLLQERLAQYERKVQKAVGVDELVRTKPGASLNIAAANRCGAYGGARTSKRASKRGGRWRHTEKPHIEKQRAATDTTLPPPPPPSLTCHTHTQVHRCSDSRPQHRAEGSPARPAQAGGSCSSGGSRCWRQRCGWWWRRCSGQWW
jgi:hypothetical protein